MIRLAKRAAKRLLRPLARPWTPRRRLARDLLRLGVRPGGILLVHSSLSSLGYVPGGTKTVIRALLEVLGPRGTLVFPTHSFQQMNDGCRRFDVRETRSCVGALSEAFRRWPGAKRSLHPTHSVAAVGPLAADLIRGHEFAATPCGAGTPYARLLERGGQVLLLGVGLKSHTAFHTVEAMADAAYLTNEEAEQFTLIDADGRPQVLPILRHAGGVPRRFPETTDLLRREGILTEGPVGPAPCMLIQGRPFLEMMLRVLRDEPEFLLARSKLQPVEP